MSVSSQQQQAASNSTTSRGRRRPLDRVTSLDIYDGPPSRILGNSANSAKHNALIEDMPVSPGGGQHETTSTTSTTASGSTPAASGTSAASIIVVSRGKTEDEPPVWTLVNSHSQMQASVNVISGTRLTHGRPMLLG